MAARVAVHSILAQLRDYATVDSPYICKWLLEASWQESCGQGSDVTGAWRRLGQPYESSVFEPWASRAVACAMRLPSLLGWRTLSGC